jgi:hypothetical protein
MPNKRIAKKPVPKELMTAIVAPKTLTYALLAKGRYVSEGEEVDRYWEYCEKEQHRRFLIFLDHIGFGVYRKRVDSELFPWRRLALKLAEDRFAGLRLPTPYRRGRSPEWKKLLDAIAREHAKAAPKQITDSEALRRAVANEANAWMARKVDTNLRRRFQAAKNRLFKEQSIASDLREPAAWWQLVLKNWREIGSAPKNAHTK